jgi:hypothetical protein
MVNEEKIDKYGLNTTYKTRVFAFVYVGKMAGIDENKLKELALLYKNELEKEEEYYIKDFEKLIEKELYGIKK